MRHELEILHFPPLECRPHPPLLFLHGAYAGAWSWEPFLRRCAEEGFDAHALSFRGHAGSSGWERMEQFGIDEFVDDVDEVVARLPAAPVIVAHSMGGYIAQRFLANGGKAAALALLASVAPYGVGFSAWYMGMTSPKLLLELNHFQQGRMTTPEVETIRDMLFSPDAPAADLQLFCQRAQPESQQALDEMLVPRPWQLWDLPRLPALVLAAGSDRVIPVPDVWATANALGVLPEFIPGVGHAMMLDAKRDLVLDRLLNWLDTLSLPFAMPT